MADKLFTEKQFDAQVNYGWGLSLNMTGKAPAVAKRIFDTYADAFGYASDVNDSAIEGLILAVVADTNASLNGVYFVEQVAANAIEADEEKGIEAVDAKPAKLVKLSSVSDNENSAEAVLQALNEYIASNDAAVSGLSDSLADAIEDLTQAIADEKARAEEAESGLTQAIADEKARAEEKEGELAQAIADEKARAEEKEGELAQAIADAKAAATTKVEKGENEAHLAVDEKTNEDGSKTYTLSSVDVASKQAMEEAIAGINEKIGEKSVAEQINAAKEELTEAFEEADDEIYAQISALTDSSKVVVAAAEQAAEGYLKTYVVTQGGNQVGTIDIPKDLVVTGGEVIVATAEDAELVEGEKYLKITIANQEKPVYIAVKDLVDVYTSGDYITVGNDNKISLNLSEVDGAILNVENSVVKAAIDAAAKAGTDAAAGVQGKLDEHLSEFESWNGDLTAILIALNDSITSAETAAKEFATESINALDAEVSGSSTHVSVKVTEENGVITTVDVSEEDVASAAKLDEVYTWTVNEKPISGSPVLTASDIKGTYGEGDAATEETVQESITNIKAELDSLGGGAGSIQSQIDSSINSLKDELKVEDVEVENNYVSEVSQLAGKIAVKRATLVNVAEDNAISLGEGGGVYLSSAWDCGTF